MKKILLISTFFLALSFTGKSSHGVGGDIQYIQTGANSYDVIMRLFRYCEPGAATLGSSYSISILDQVTCANVSSVTATRDTFYQINFGDECYTPPGLCVETHIYTGSISFLANNPNGYMSTWSLCCRNTILNVTANNLGLYTKFPDPALAGGNSTPLFVDYPTDGYFCIGFDKQIDFSCTDADGDSLAYFLVNPISTFAGCTPNLLGWNAGFNLMNILGPGSLCTINSSTGIVTARPAQLGKYVISVKVIEYRNGVKIGETVRDIQYAALRCSYNSKPVLENFSARSIFEFDEEKCIDLVANDPNGNDTFFLQISSNAFQFGAVVNLPAPTGGVYVFEWEDATDGSLDTAQISNVRKINSTTFEGVGKVGARFCWDVNECEILSLDSFYIEALGYSLGCDGSKDTVSRRVSVPIKRDPYSYNVPNVFSPNDDGINDLFYLKKDAYDRCFDALNVRVYNRWGQIVFESEDAKFTWDGTDQNGSKLSEGTYFVVLQGFYGGKEVTENFPLTLFR
jgi:gliding motility-associated-like protein